MPANGRRRDRTGAAIVIALCVIAVLAIVAGALFVADAILGLGASP